MQEKFIKNCSIHGELSPDKILKEKNNSKKGYLLRCYFCRRKTQKRYYKSHAPILIKKIGIWKKANRKKINEQAKEDRKINPEKHKEWSRRTREKAGSYRNVIEICRRHKITTEQYEQLLAAQNNKCAICLSSEKRKNRSGNIARLCLDHNHRTLAIRKFLCHDCNTMIGKFCESIEIMKSAINYLTKQGELCQK